jgi:hypothetical protein
MLKPGRPLTKDEVLDSLHTMLACGPRHVIIPRVTQEEGSNGNVQVFIVASDGQRWQIDIRKAEAKRPPVGRGLRHRRESEDEYELND